MGKEHKTYPEILDNILDRTFSNCNCPQKYMISPLKNKTECLFGTDCQFSRKCSYEESKCTCFPDCTCSTDSDLSTETDCNCNESCDSKSELEDDDCTCIGICNCNSSQVQIFKPPTKCNKNICTCKSCLCQSIFPSSKLLPNYFRNTVKKEQHKEHKYISIFKLDKSIAKQLEEMKEVMESQKQIKGEFDHINFNLSSENSKKSAPLQLLPSKSSKSLLPIAEKAVEDTEYNHEIYNEKNYVTEPKGQSYNQNTPQTSIKRKKITKKKQNYSKPKCEHEHFKEKKPSLKKPMRIRYYYSGGTEHYGVKLGHNHCLESKVTHNKMPWQWHSHRNSINNEGRGSPGFIHKSIKNMIKTMKDASEKKGKKSEHSLDTKSYDANAAGEYQCEDEPPLIHIHNKGRKYHVTFCPKESDSDIKPIPIPFAFTRKKEEGDTETTEESTLEFELYSPKPHKDNEQKKLKEKNKKLTSTEAPDTNKLLNDTKLRKKDKDTLNMITPTVDLMTTEASNDKKGRKKEKINKLMSISSIGPNNEFVPSKGSKTKEKDKSNKLKSAGSQENKVLWEEHQTQMQKHQSLVQSTK